MKTDEPIKVIVDLDTGFDDAWALFILLKSHFEKSHLILAITCVNGNTTVKHVAKNVQRCFNVFEEQYNVKLNIPIYIGCTESLLNKYYEKNYTGFHGSDGLCDVLTDQPSEENLQSKHAIIALQQFINDHPKEIVLICMGPLTNLAMTMKLDCSIAEKLKALYIMGGNNLGIGNVTRCAEFNFYVDPEAAHIVLEKIRCAVTIVTWETSSYPRFQIPWEWRINVLGAFTTPIVQFMNAIEERRIDYKGKKGWEICDAVLMGCFLMKEKLVKRSSDFHATVELGGFYTRGQMILDHSKAMDSNVVIVEEVNCDVFKNLVKWAVE